MQDKAYKKYLLGILLVTLAFNSVDRLALGLVLQDIKADLQLSDSQLGLLTGFAFALFYSTMGIPIARWADRGNRVRIISLTTALSSTLVALCSTATSFVQLLLLRVGVAVGEAGCVPPAHSLIADRFARAERPRAVAIYMLGGSLSLFTGYFVAGWLNELYGWRAMFVLLGIPGIALAMLTWFTVREPRRAGGPAALAPAAAQPSMARVCVALWAIPTFRHLLAAFSVIFFLNYGISQWLPAFFIRVHGLQTGELGTWFALIFGLSSFAGIYLGGELATRHAANDERRQLRILAFLFAALTAIRPVTYLVPDVYWAFALLVPTVLVITVGDGPLFAVIQTLVPENMRAMSIALIYLFANLIGMGLGPLVAGALSDLLRPWAGDESLRYALIALCPGYLWAMWHLWRASETVERDLGVAHGGRSAPASHPLPRPSETGAGR